MFDDVRETGLGLFVWEGYRTIEKQKQIMEEKIEENRDTGYSRKEAKDLAEKYVVKLGASEHELVIDVDINADISKCIIRCCLYIA